MGNRLTTGQKNSYSFEQHRSLTVTQTQNFGNRELERNWTDLNVVRWRSHFQSTDVTTEPETNFGQKNNLATGQKEIDSEQPSNLATGQLSNNSTIEQSNFGTIQIGRRDFERQSNFGTIQRGRRDFERQRNIGTLHERGNYGRLRNLATGLISDAEQLRNFAEQLSNLATEQRGDSVQQSNNATAEQEKCYDPKDTTLIFVDGEDDHDFERNDFKSLRAKMSCGHTVTPMSLTNWCKHLLSQGEIRFVCGQPDCNVEWTYDEVWKMALLTPEEMEYFDKKMFSRAAKEFLDFKSCPGCKCSVVRSDVNNLRVCCVMCTAKTNVAFSFCWQCLEEWKGPSPYPDRCANEGCTNKQLEILNTCPDITFEDVRGVAGCPSVRACPTCGLLLEHNRTKCKNIRCTRCKLEFCFVCLKLTEECLAQEKSSHYICCQSGVAPRQTTIPVWQRK